MKRVFHIPQMSPVGFHAVDQRPPLSQSAVGLIALVVFGLTAAVYCFLWFRL